MKKGGLVIQRERKCGKQGKRELEKKEQIPYFGSGGEGVSRNFVLRLGKNKG